MCVVGLYFVFLLLEDVIIGYYSTDAASQDEEMNIKVAYDILQKNSSINTNIYKNKNGKHKIHFIYNISDIPNIPYKKQQLGRVTRKQYEIVNMLWRKTKIFVDEDYMYRSTPTSRNLSTKRILRRFQQDKPIIMSIPVTSSLQTTTPSNIEFYYLDDTQEHSKRESKSKQNNERATSAKNTKTTSTSFLVFHLKGPYAKPLSNKWNTVVYSGVRLHKPQENTYRSNFDQSLNKKIVENKNNVKQLASLKIFPGNQYFFISTPLPKSIITNVVNITQVTRPKSESTTVYDKIKFFEIYDQNTIKNTDYKNTAIKGKSSSINGNESNDNQKILLEHVDHGSHDHDKAKHSKKHVTDSVQNLHFIIKKNNAIDPKLQVTQKTQASKTSIIKLNPNKTKSHSRKNDSISYNHMNHNVSWKEYPFVAVYTYEPSQVHCDAASINAHWLVASGSCLSRVSKSPESEGQSAFVSYCGEKWWRPERVSYVKYSFVHPLYHPRDKTRRHLYNIGVIQVVNSMRKACNGWAPVSMMSHQYVADPGGSNAFALGWGLDRFDTRYSATDLPKIPLMIYKGQVYIDSCPGNVGYSKAKRLDEGGGVKNVHCLSLPPYSGEENDPVHGGLLLVEGKLIAMYLQEERRPWGEQSAQYTGIWRQIPWVTDLARETDDVETIFDV